MINEYWHDYEITWSGRVNIEHMKDDIDSN